MPGSGIEQRVAARVRALRTGAGLSARGLALRAGITPEMVSRIESGDRSPRLETLERLCTALGIRVSNFFEFDEPAATGRAPRERASSLSVLERQMQRLDEEQRKLMLDAFLLLVRASRAASPTVPRR